METLEALDNTLVYLHARRQKRLGRKRALWHCTDEIYHERRRPNWRRPNSCSLGWTNWAAPVVQPLRRRFGAPINTPFQWTKQVASHWGGTRNGMVVHWPKGIEAKGEMRSQFHHVIDIAPTMLRPLACPSRSLSTVSSSSRSKASTWRIPLTTQAH